MSDRSNPYSRVLLRLLKMHGATSCLTIVALLLASCSPYYREQDGTPEAYVAPSEIDAVLSSLSKFDRIEVWTRDGERFEALFYSYQSEELYVGDKWFGGIGLRGEGLRSDRLEYRLEDVVRLKTEVRSRSSVAAVVLLVAAFGVVMVIAMGMGAADSGFSSITVF